MSLRLTDAQRLDWLRLVRTDGVGPRTFQGLLNHHGGAAAAIDALPGLAARRGRPAPKVPSRADAERELVAAQRLGARLVALGEAEYPAALRAIDAAPPLLLVRGRAAVLAMPMVAIVGSRNASAAGLRVAERLARGAGEGGVAVVSGLARGIDARAHEAALELGTVAVLAGGHDKPYPPENVRLLDLIAERGAVLSEMPMGYAPRGRDFPRRNRLVSGLALATVVVEAARRSGSLITARFANEQGRPVLAVPGSPLDPRAEGPNDLIREGATLIATAEHLMEELRPMLAAGEPPPVLREGPRAAAEPLWDEFDDFGAPAPLAAPQDEEDAPPGAEGPTARMVAVLGAAPVDVDDLARAAGLSAREARLALLDLEMAGRLERHGANQVSLNGEGR